MTDERGHLSDESNEEEFMDKAREGTDQALERADEVEERMTSNVDRARELRRAGQGAQPGRRRQGL